MFNTEKYIFCSYVIQLNGKSTILNKCNWENPESDEKQFMI